MKRKIRVLENVINFIFFFIGIYGLWNLTHNWVALGWCLIASLHINVERFLEDKNELPNTK